MSSAVDEAALAKVYRPDTAINLSPQDNTAVHLSGGIQQYITSQLGLDPEALLKLPVLSSSPVDDSHPANDYFISSSHNTYLMARQLLGHSTAAAYTHVLSHGARCVEIDVWPSAKGPIVTHGHTFSKSIPFLDVCKAIGNYVAPNHWPVLVSLECHVGVEGQPEMVDLMDRTWGDKLVKEVLHGTTPEGVSPQALKGKIVLMVEYYHAPAPGEEPADVSSDSSTDSESSQEWHTQVLSKLVGRKRSTKNRPVKAKISDTLAALGPYARSMKPEKDWHTERSGYPVPVMINISESGMSPLLPHSLKHLISHSRRHLRRVYPKGLRVASGNQNPLTQWQNGSQIVCLNWQKYDTGMQLNEALFVGTPGWVLKPTHMRGFPEERPKRVKFLGHVYGVSAMPCPADTTKFHSYVRVQLMHTKRTHEWKTKSKQGEAPHGSTSVDLVWDEKFQFSYDSDELAFLRILLQEDEYGRDDELAVFCARLSRVQQGWRLVRLLNMKGNDSGATLLISLALEES